MKIALGVLVFLTLGIALCSFPKKVQTYSDGDIKAGDIRRPISAFSAHSGTEHYLEIQEKIFKHVRGLSPYFLVLTNLESIIFVTEAPGEKVRFHVFNTREKKESSIDGHELGFGWNIGSDRRPGEPFSDYIETATSNTVLLATRSLDWKEVATLNLPERRIQQVDVYYYNSSGQVTNHLVHRY